MMKTISSKLVFSVMLALGLIGSNAASAQSPRIPAEPNLAQLHTLAEDDLAPSERPRRFRRWQEGGTEQRQHARQQRIQRARTMARRLLDNPNTPEEVRAKAQRLDELLAKREALANELGTKRQEFLDAHRQELDELRHLRERSQVLRQNLRAAREKALAENMSQIQEVRRLTREARETAQDIRRQYRERQREKGLEPGDK